MTELHADIPGGTVTTADLYRKLEGMSDVMIRLDERVKVLPDLEIRVRRLEGFRFLLLGASTTVATLFGAASGILAALITRGGHP